MQFSDGLWFFMYYFMYYTEICGGSPPDKSIII